MELPQYTLNLSLPRILLPKTASLIFLGGFLYFGVWLNLLILNIIMPTEYHLYIVLGIILLLIIQFILNYLKFSNYRYLFYKDRLVFIGKKQKIISYSDVQNLSFKREFLDKLFNTGTIILQPAIKIKYIGNTNQVYFYLQKLLQFSRQSTPQYQPQQYQQSYYQQQV